MMDAMQTLSEEDQARADMYALIATLLLKPPSPALLAALAVSPPFPGAAREQPLGAAWDALVAAAQADDIPTIEDEFDALFTGIGMPLLNPYGSRYLTGFMMEKPLAALRDDLAALGFSRTRKAAESEDHLGALCETMRLLIGGTHAASPFPLAVQKSFFARHLEPWYARCLDDVQSAQPARFYRRVAAFARLFLDLERAAFQMDDHADDACTYTQSRPDNRSNA